MPSFGTEHLAANARRASGPLLRLAAFFIALLPALATAQQTDWQLDPVFTGDWFMPSNWSNGVPTDAKFAFIDNGGVVTLSSGTADTDGLRVGVNNTGHLEQYGGTLHADTGFSAIGQQLGSFGKVTVYDGTFTVDRGMTIGGQGTGQFLQFGGAVSLLDDFHYLGTSAAGEGTYRLVDGSFSAPVGFTVGNFGTGTFVQYGGTATMGYVAIGRQLGSTGTYELRGGTLTTGSTSVGSGNSSFVHGAATHEAEFLNVGAGGGANGSTATYEMNDDASRLIVLGETIGGGSDATFTQWAGTHEVGYQLTVNSSKSGTFNLNGGTLTTRFTAVAGSGTGVINQAGGVHTVTEDLVLGPELLASSKTGYYNLTGGTLDVQQNVYVGNRSPGEFKQTGGVFQVDGNLTVGDRSTGAYYIDDGELSVGGNLTIGVVAGVQKQLTIVGGLGQIDVGGNFVLGPFGGEPLNRPVIDVTLDATGLSTIDVDGMAMVQGGRIRVHFADGFTPHLGQQFVLLTADGGVTGDPLFQGIGAARDSFEVLRTANSIVFVSLVPEPGSFVLAGLGLLVLGICRRRKRSCQQRRMLA